jgi:hypothetical protein
VKYQLVKPSPDATTLVAKQINEVGTIAGAFPGVLGGD